MAVRQTTTVRRLKSDVAAAEATADANRKRADRVEELLTRTTPQQRTIQRLLTTRGSSVARLRTTAGSALVDVVVAADGQGYLVTHSLPKLSAGHVYQLWGVAGDVVLSLGVLGSSPSTLEFAAHERWTKFVLTDELSPGVASSTRPAYAAGDVRTV